MRDKNRTLIFLVGPLKRAKFSRPLRNINHHKALILRITLLSLRMLRK